MRLFSSLLLLLLAVPAAAQEREIRSANLPPELEWELIRLYDGGAERYEGPALIAASDVIHGAVAALGGPLRIAGRVEGDVAMVEGDVVIEPGGAVDGDVVVVGGEVRLGDGAEVAGSITAYALGERNRWGERDDRDEDDDWWERRRRHRWDGGHSRITVRAGSGYNRVEGLPVMFGPVIETSGEYPLRLEALAIWRTESESLDTDRMGYQAEAEQFFGRGRTFGVGGSAFSVVAPLDRWQLSDLEASLAAAVFHDDYRDYYDRTGWSVFATAEPVRGLEARVEYRDEDHLALAAADPWSLFDGDEPWRLQPMVAEGDLQTLTGSLELDLRDDEDEPERGWYGRIAVERPVGGALMRPALLDVTPRGEGVPSTSGFLPAAELDTDFTSGYIDLRRYTPVGWSSQLNLRVVAGGGLTAAPLPAQFQHSLGGIGTLPGFASFHGDCGARTATGGRGTDRYFVSYGCDRFALAQVEYRGTLFLDFGFGDPDYDDDDWWDDVEIDLSPTWVVFMDAGHGWAYDDPALGGDRETGTLVDAGVGFLIDELGIYAALPLNGDVDQEPRFFIRLGRRF